MKMNRGSALALTLLLRLSWLSILLVSVQARFGQVESLKTPPAYLELAWVVAPSSSLAAGNGSAEVLLAVARGNNASDYASVYLVSALSGAGLFEWSPFALNFANCAGNNMGTFAAAVFYYSSSNAVMVCSNNNYTSYFYDVLVNPQTGALSVQRKLSVPQVVPLTLDANAQVLWLGNATSISGTYVQQLQLESFTISDLIPFSLDANVILSFAAVQQPQAMPRQENAASKLPQSMLLFSGLLSNGTCAVVGISSQQGQRVVHGACDTCLSFAAFGPTNLTTLVSDASNIQHYEAPVRVASATLDTMSSVLRVGRQAPIPSPMSNVAFPDLAVAGECSYFVNARGNLVRVGHSRLDVAPSIHESRIIAPGLSVKTASSSFVYLADSAMIVRVEAFCRSSSKTPGGPK